jgi:anti-anti-sigma factor
METNPEPPVPIDILISSSRGAIAVDVCGDVDAATVDVLDAALVALDDAPQLIVDLSAALFIDIAGIRALATCARRRRSRGRDLLVLSPPPAAESILRLPPFSEDLQWLSRQDRAPRPEPN